MRDLSQDSSKRPTMNRLFLRLLELQAELGDSLDLESSFPDLG